MVRTQRPRTWSLLEFVSRHPIDLEALVLESQRPYRPTRETIARQIETRKRNRKRKFAEAVERTRRESTPGPPKVKNRYAILNVMEPGRWYSMPDTLAAANVHRNPGHATFVRMREQGFLERAKNPNWVPRPERRNPTEMVSEYLYRLTRAGELERAAWLAAGAPAETVKPAVLKPVRFADPAGGG